MPAPLERRGWMVLSPAVAWRRAAGRGQATPGGGGSGGRRRRWWRVDLDHGARARSVAAGVEVARSAMMTPVAVLR